jgi:hypothetical protein
MQGLFSASAAVLLLSAAACKTSNPKVPRLASTSQDAAEVAVAAPAKPEPQPRSESSGAAQPTIPVEAALRPSEPVVARIGGEDVYVSELLANWMMVDSVGLRDLLENLVVERLVMQEARRLGLRVDEARVAEEYTRALTELESGLREKQPGVSLDEWIAKSLGLEPRRYREGLERDVRRRLHTQRVVRRFILGQEWADVRVLVLETREEAEAALTRLRAGEPFARVAAEVSIDPSGKRGGRIPPIVRNASALARLAFATPAGELGGPILEAQRWIVLETRELHAPLVGGWNEVGPQVEESLAARPVEELEFMLWKVEMSANEPADFEPLFELIRR